MLQVVDIVSSFYSKDLSSCYSYGRLYRQHTSGWEGYKSAKCNKIAVKREVALKRRSKPQICHLEMEASTNFVFKIWRGFCLFLLIYPEGGREGTFFWTFTICLTSCYIKSQTSFHLSLPARKCLTMSGCRDMGRVQRLWGPMRHPAGPGQFLGYN
jgi:hypothetical protein